MSGPRLRVRTLLIAVAVLSPFLAAGVWLFQIGQGLEDFYGPGGFLDREHNLSNTIAAGDGELARGRFAEAETLYRTAIRLQAEHVARSGPKNSLAGDWFLIGLADALAGQGHAAGADIQYRKAVAAYDADTNPRNTALDAVLMRYSAFLRREGREDEARSCEDRAIAALDRSAAYFREEKRGEVAEALEGRARAIRARRVR